MKRWLLQVLIDLAYLVPMIVCHGRLIDPPGRSSMFRFGYDTPPNYDDNQLFCGGFQVQYGQNGGKCGICGDPYNGARENEAGGKYAKGIIVRQYNMDSTITVTYQLTANHKGWVEFKICPNNDVNTPGTQECFDQYLLQQPNGNTRIPAPDGTGEFQVTLQLPTGLTCSQCIIQWRYHAGNSWGTDPDGTSCVGCGNQEEFYACADVMIGQNMEQVTDPSVPDIPEGNDPNMTDYEDWDWDTEPPSTSGSVSITAFGCMFLALVIVKSIALIL